MYQLQLVFPSHLSYFYASVTQKNYKVTKNRSYKELQNKKIKNKKRVGRREKT